MSPISRIQNKVKLRLQKCVNQLPTHDPSSIRFFAAQVDKTRRLPDITGMILGPSNTILRANISFVAVLALLELNRWKGATNYF